MNLDEVHILVIADRCWGKALTLKEAMANANRAGGLRCNGRQRWQAFICHKDTSMDDMGRVSFPTGCTPREITRMGREFIKFSG